MKDLIKKKKWKNKLCERKIKLNFFFFKSWGSHFPLESCTAFTRDTLILSSSKISPMDTWAWPSKICDLFSFFIFIMLLMGHQYQKIWMYNVGVIRTIIIIIVVINKGQTTWILFLNSLAFIFRFDSFTLFVATNISLLYSSFRPTTKTDLMLLIQL